jgi:pimeloyl-ACP methyl ester carboxylesterase
MYHSTFLSVSNGTDANDVNVCQKQTLSISLTNAEKFTLAQAANGGYYIQAFIARHPKMVSAFIGIGTTPYGHEYYSKSDIFWLKQVGWMGMCYPLKAMKKASSKQATSTKIGYENMMEMLAPYGKREYCDLMQRAYNAFLQDNFDLEITCPVLITSGEFDKVGKSCLKNFMEFLFNCKVSGQKLLILKKFKIRS